MFNIHKVKPAFINDSYGFTESLISYINNNSNDILPLKDSLQLILHKAYKSNCTEEKKILQNALFMIYQINLAFPLCLLAQKQYDENLLKIRSEIEDAWFEHEFKHMPPYEEPDSSVNFADYLKKIWKEHPASHHELFDFLEKDAPKEQLYLFFKSDSALNLLFFDLVAYTLIGSQPETRGTISENLWDEVGHGDDVLTHVNLYKNVLERRNIELPADHYIDLYEEDALAGYNAFMSGAVNRKHYYKLLGVMAMTEVLDPPQYTKLVNGCLRLGLTDKDVHYYTEHITIDIKHGDDWLYKVINVISEKYPESKKEFYLGSLLRLQTAERYYNHLLKKMKKIGN